MNVMRVGGGSQDHSLEFHVDISILLPMAVRKYIVFLQNMIFLHRHSPWFQSGGGFIGILESVKAVSVR